MNKEEKNIIQVKPCTVKELALMYGVSRITFRKWLNKFKAELGERNGRYFSIPQVKIIFRHLDVPSTIETT